MATSSMSKTAKRNILLVVAAVVVIALVWLLPDKGGSQLKSFPAIKESPDRIVFTHASDEFAIVLEDGDWWVEGKGYPVDKNKVEKAIEFLTKEVKVEVVSGADVYTPYGLDQGDRFQIDFYSGDKLLKTVKVGKSANRIGTFYGLVDDSDLVYQISFNRYDLDYEERYILDLKMFDFSPPTIVKANFVEQGGQTWDLDRVEKKDEASTNQTPAEKVWQDGDGKVFPKEKVNDIINILSTLNAEDLTDEPDFEWDNLSPLRKIILSDENGKTYRLDILKQTEEGYWLKIPEKDYFYRISTLDGEKLLTDISP